MIATFTLNAAIDRTVRLPSFERKTLNRAALIAVRAGGKGLNVASIARLLGADVTASGFIGGYAGAFIRDYIGRLGIHADFVEIEGESRTCVAIMETDTGDLTEIAEDGPELDIDNIARLEKKVRDLASTARVAVFSGSLPCGCPDDTYARLIRAAKDEKCMTFLDTSGNALREGLKACPDYVKPNAAELESLAQGNVQSIADVIEAARCIRESCHVPNVVVTLGAEGAFAFTPEGEFRVCVPRLPVRNPVGCGDAFAAGMCVALERGLPLEDVLRTGAAAASAKLGADDAGICSPEDVARLLGEIRLIRS